MTVKVWQLAAGLAAVAFIGGMLMLGLRSARSSNERAHDAYATGNCLVSKGLRVSVDPESLPVKGSRGSLEVEFADGTDAVEVVFTRSRSEGKTIENTLVATAGAFGVSESQVHSVTHVQGDVVWWFTGDRDRTSELSGCLP